MTENNGNSAKHRVLVVGGIDKNVPAWAWRAFDVEVVNNRNENLEVNAPYPDAIVVALSWVSHEQVEQAISFGKEHEIPVLRTRGGWSSAVQRAAKLRIDWFVQAAQRTSEEVDQEDEEAVEAAAELHREVYNSWDAAVAHERARADAAIKRLSLTERRLRSASTKIERLEQRIVDLQDENKTRHAAANRVIKEVRQRAAEVRQREERIRRAADDVRRLIAGFRESMHAVDVLLDGTSEEVDGSAG